MTDTVLLVGCGNMGFALLKGWLRGGLSPAQLHVVEPVDELRDRAGATSAACYDSAASLPADLSPRLVVLAVKPQVIMDVLPDYGRFGGGPSTFLSIVAGVGSAAIQNALGAGTPVIRCMPNTPAAIGQGAIVCFSNEQVSADDTAFAQQLLCAAGKVWSVDDEGLMDAVTAVSGSGPAYVFHMVECLAAAARSAGLPDELADALALQTVGGAARLAVESDTAPARLREQVTSPRGTTAAALSVLTEDDRLRALMTEAVAAATKRSREMGGN